VKSVEGLQDARFARKTKSFYFEEKNREILYIRANVTTQKQTISDPNKRVMSVKMVETRVNLLFCV
jgi:hypothetical protein